MKQATTENKFPTICDLRDALTRLVDFGIGDLPVQVLVVPDSSMQAIARVSAPPGYNHEKPALMIEFDGVDGRLGANIMSTDRLQGSEMPPTATQ